MCSDTSPYRLNKGVPPPLRRLGDLEHAKLDSGRFLCQAVLVISSRSIQKKKKEEISMITREHVQSNKKNSNEHIA